MRVIRNFFWALLLTFAIILIVGVQGWDIWLFLVAWMVGCAVDRHRSMNRDSHK